MQSSSSSSSLSSRIRESAAGLTKDIFSNSINGHGALEATDELVTLRSSHKLSSAPSFGTSSSPQLSQVLSRRQQHFGSEPFRSLNLDLDSNSTSDAGQELSDFLLHENVLSSQPGPVSDLALTNGSETERGYRDHLRRNDSFDPELSRYKERVPPQQLNLGRELSQHNHGQNDLSLKLQYQEVPLAMSSLPTNHSHAVVGGRSSDLASARQKERALNRLHLIFSQMPATTKALNVATAKQTQSLESSYNQLCGGEDAQEWAEFEAHMFRTYSNQSRATGQGSVQRQQYEPSTIVAARQAPLQADRYESHMLQHSKPSREGGLQQYQTPKKDGEQSQSKEPIVEFHCPWIKCHDRFQKCTDDIVNTVNPGSLPCIHTDCELKFATEEVWRVHVDIAHHNLLPRPQLVGAAELDTAWEKAQIAERCM
ncbi:hypothetical protein E4T44_09783 [Aureobasidium sp. EXF-8845]|nr:hypothetical protein E4T44_09783 [Aureobasidium sp. EXF-8845]KAI4839163.1 hypothetical protein E4T45_09658 [Aureobasidium sp. EXF-8846]